MSTVYLLKYNNYYNRIVKKEDTLGAYLTQDYLLDTFENVNFVPADGVNTTLTVNHQGTNPDYVVIANGDVIESRWFVIEADIIRGGQYSLTLHRDVIVDSYDLVINAPCFIEKATLKGSDPFIFNDENMTFNQIKKDETPLKDETGCAWVVGYIPRDALQDKALTTDYTLEGIADITVENLADWEYNQYVQNPFKGYFNNITYGGFVYGYWRSADPRMIGFGCYSNGALVPKYDENAIPGMGTTYDSANYLTYGGNAVMNSTLLNGLRANGSSGWRSKIGEANALTVAALGLNSQSDTTNFDNLNGQVIYESSTQTYRRVNVNKSYKSRAYAVQRSGGTTALYNWMAQNITRAWGGQYNIKGDVGPNSFKMLVEYYEYKITYEQLFNQATTTIPADRYHLEDQPYDMFCIPYSNDLTIYKNEVVDIRHTSKSLAISVATAISKELGSGSIYDIQLLPYCPVRYCILPDGHFDIKNSKVNYIKDSKGANVSVMLWATTSSFTFDIEKSIPSANPKIEHLTEKWRLCSPNFNGQFEFSVAMNGGVNRFNVDCTYKPYNPYIHVNPNFKNLYGQDFNDARGLICGGDFSLPIVTNAWADYQLNNKNYENIFNREIQNLQVQQKYQKIGDIVSAVAGIGGGAAAGSMVGGSAGAMVGGAVLGGAASLGAGIGDIVINDKLRAEAMDYKKDMFGMQMGNIQAIPSNITKTTAFTYNNKIFPILEFYTCTTEEVSALLGKLQYNGMTVGRIGKIADYLANASDQYIKGRIIRIEGVSDDFHYYKAISDEIYKGAFF